MMSGFHALEAEVITALTDNISLLHRLINHTIIAFWRWTVSGTLVV
jgi:hypothetical protein